MHTLSLELNTSPYPVLHDLVCIVENQNNTLCVKIVQNEDKDEIFITFPEKQEEALRS